MRLVTTLPAESPEALQRMSKACPTDWVEVRLDFLKGLEPGQVPDLRRRVRQRAIATCRGAQEGGQFRASEGEREALLRAALAAGFDALDLEADAKFLRPLAEAARRAGAEVIVSRHDLRPAHRAEDLEAFAHAIPPGAIAKYAAEVHGPEDLAALVRAAALLRDAGVRYAVMGLGDASLRLFAPLLGSELVYCSASEGPVVARGQLPAPAVQAVHDLLPRAPRITGAHRLVALLGDPVGHSLSPAMQNAAFAAGHDALAYVALRTPPAKLRAVLAGLRAMDFAGANVTTPLKDPALKLMDRLDPSARQAGAVNTIVARNGKLTGHTTDGEGAVAALQEAGAEVRGGTALVLGAGGTARAVAHALAKHKARVLVANRTAAKGKALAKAVGGEAVGWKGADLASAVARATVLVQCTPVGRDGQASPVPERVLHDKLAVLDAVYRPGGTPLVRAAKAKGGLALPGEALLLHQGALSYALWTGKDAPLGAMRAALLQEAP